MHRAAELVHRSRVLPILAAGGVGFIFQIGIFEVLAVWWQLTPHSVAAVLGAEVGILVNFFINDRLSFRHRLHKLPLVHRLVRHQAVVLVAVFLQWLLVYTTEQFTADFWPLHLALFAGIALGFLWNYAWYHLFVWRHHPPPEI